MAILGIDEAGRGPWAGPLVVGAVILCKTPGSYPSWVADLNDSKRLTKNKRLTLSKLISTEAVTSALGWVSAMELDRVGLGDALRLATHRAVEQIQHQGANFSEIIIDGPVNFLSDTPLSDYTTTLKKADTLIKEVSAASIIAKVARDDYMEKIARLFPDYAFGQHVGYGTALHRSALQRLGPTAEHRFSFRPVAKIATQFPDLAEQFSDRFEPTKSDTTSDSIATFEPDFASANATTLGRHAENAVADYLSTQGHTILLRNHKTKFYEIDLISAAAEKLFFTEVKYRRDTARGGALAAVTPAKLKRMRFAAESFLKYIGQSQYAKLQPTLAVATVSGSDFTVDDFFELDSSYFDSML